MTRPLSNPDNGRALPSPTVLDRITADDLRDRAMGPAHRFEGWRPLANGMSQRLDLSAATSLDEAIQRAQLSCEHKDHFTILHAKPNGETVEHVFYVKQTKPVWIRKEGFAHSVQVKPLQSELLFSRQMAACAPVEPWRWTRDADVIGGDGVIALTPQRMENRHG